MRYQFDNGIWSSQNSQVYQADMNQAVTMQVIDAAGNQAATAVQATVQIDKTSPSLSVTTGSYVPNNWTRFAVTVTATASDSSSGSGIKDYSFDNGVTWQSGASKLFNSSTLNLSCVVKVRDSAGNVTAAPPKVILIDRTKPSMPELTLSVNAVLNATKNIWYSKEQVQVSPYVSINPFSGVSRFEFDMNDIIAGEINPGDSVNLPDPLPESGIPQSFAFYTFNNVGTRSTNSTPLTIEIDTDAPTVSAEIVDANTSAVSLILNALTGNQFFGTAQYLEVTAADTGVGLGSLLAQKTVSGTTTTLTPIIGFANRFALPHQFTGQISVTAADLLGNQQSISSVNSGGFAITVNTAALDISEMTVSSSYDLVNSPWTNSASVTLTAAGATAATGVDKYQYSLDQGA
ncbi:MAG: hypothetical protein EOM08_15360, partial [Clostridia bacterium]|nr:hypothetical protein [Clostridia bacterium]